MGRVRLWWFERKPRERTLIGAGAATLVVVLVAVFAWLPLERSRTRLAAEIPKLRASISTMDRQAGEVRRLRTLSEVAPAASSPLAALASGGSLARDLPGAEITLADEKHVRLVAADVAFGSLLEWIAAMQSAHGLRVEAARIEALSTPGRVRADMRLART